MTKAKKETIEEVVKKTAIETSREAVRQCREEVDSMVAKKMDEYIRVCNTADQSRQARFEKMLKDIKKTVDKTDLLLKGNKIFNPREKGLVEKVDEMWGRYNLLVAFVSFLGIGSLYGLIELIKLLASLL